MVCRIVGTSFSVIVENEKEVEISFTSKWDPSLEGEKAPLNIDKRQVTYIIMKSIIIINQLIN